MTRQPVSRKFRSLDDALAWVDQLFEDKLREFQTALLIDMPAHGVDVDHDAYAELIEDSRREWSIQRDHLREHLRRELIEWLANGRNWNSAKGSAVLAVWRPERDRTCLKARIPPDSPGCR